MKCIEEVGEEVEPPPVQVEEGWGAIVPVLGRGAIVFAPTAGTASLTRPASPVMRETALNAARACSVNKHPSFGKGQ